MRHSFLFLIGAVCSLSVSAQDHGHLNVGAAGDALTWDNGADFHPGSGYVKTLTFTNAAKYAGFYQGNITLTAMHSRDPFGALDPAAPKPGAFIVAEIVSVEGPAGGSFAFWESSSTEGNPTVSIPSGTTNATFRLEVSESALGAGQPDGDAFGHYHGRRMTATLPGIYTVGFRAYDTSTNGANAGPLHTPAPIQFVAFQAGVVLRDVEVDLNQSSVILGAMAGFSWQLQSTDTLPSRRWTEVGDPVIGNDSFVTMSDSRPRTGQRFYRALGMPVIP